MNADDYFQKTKKLPHKSKPRSRTLPKAKNAYLVAEEEFEHALGVLGIKYQKNFKFKSTKHWRFDFHLIEHKILVEISGGPWSGGRSGKLANKAWSVDRYDHAEEMGYLVVRLESSSRYKVNDNGPLQVESIHASQWLKNLKRHSLNGTDQTISTDRSN